MYYVMRASAPSLHRESTDSLIYIYIYIYILSFDCKTRNIVLKSRAQFARTGIFKILRKKLAAK